MKSADHPPKAAPAYVLHRQGSVVRFTPWGKDRVDVDFGNATHSATLTADEARQLYKLVVQFGFGVK